MSDFTIEQLEALKEGTTPGPWDEDVIYPDCSYIVDDTGGRDAALAFTAPALVDALIAEKQAHAKLLRKLDEMLSWWGKSSEKLSARGMEELAEVSRSRTAQLTRILEGDNE